MQAHFLPAWILAGHACKASTAQLFLEGRLKVNSVKYKNKEYAISQCNNALVFPGIGLGVLVSRAKYVTDDMLWEASRTLGQLSGDALLPTLDQSRETAFLIAKAVAEKTKEGVENVKGAATSGTEGVGHKVKAQVHKAKARHHGKKAKAAAKKAVQ